MDGERKRPKGGFFNLFDWNGRKSRKKLFANNSEMPEESKQGKETVESMAKALLHVIEVDEKRANSSNKGSSDFSCASSVTSDEGYRSRAPGVVARLMGLDSVPTSSVAQFSSTPFVSSGSFRASYYDRTTTDSWSEYDPIEYLKIPNKHNMYSSNAVESRLQKGQNRPTERFQTEILPPKSAKAISITHHRLLSPIRTPGFVPTKDVDYIVEAAAKIIEASPKAATNAKVPSIISSSVPLRIRDLKQKMEAASATSRPQKSRDASTAKNANRPRSNKAQGASESMPSSKVPMFREKGTPYGLRNKGKSASLAVPAKGDVQRREASTSRRGSIMKQKEQNEVKSNYPRKSQPGMQTTVQKRISESRTNNALRQNNQKQNCTSNKDSSAVKTSRDDSSGKSSVSSQQVRKVQSRSSSIGTSRSVNKVVVRPETAPRRIDSVASDSDSEKLHNISQKKQLVNGNLQIGGSVSENLPFNTSARSIQHNVAMDRGMDKGTNSRKDGMDVVSFTFSSPMRVMSSPKPSDPMMGSSSSSAVDACGIHGHLHINNSMSSGLNVIDSDALGDLLEQKLRELANKVESSHCNVIAVETSASSTSSLRDSEFNVLSGPPIVQDRMLQLVPHKELSSNLDDFDCLLVEDSQLNLDAKWQQLDEIEEHSSSSNYSETGKELEWPHPSPVSILEPSFASGSSLHLNGTKNYLSVPAPQLFNGISAVESLELEYAMELWDSASSISTVEVGRKHTTQIFPMTEDQESSDQELDYVREVLNSAELMLIDFALGRTFTVMNPNLFDQLENRENAMEQNDEEYLKLGRKVLFDYVGECLEFICSQMFVGSCKAWAKWWTLLERKGWLAEEFYKAIVGWKGMGDTMVDELVDKDMSKKQGTWLDFNIEAFEEGVEIENGILTCLVDELVSDLLLL